MACVCWWMGSKKIYLSVLELPIMYLAWKIVRSLGCYVDNESIPLKIIFISDLKARALAPLQIPASLCEGPIYLLLCRVIISYKKVLVGEHRCHLYALLLIVIE